MRMNKKWAKVSALSMAIVMTTGMLAGCGGSSSNKDGYASEIYLYNWSEYMSQDVLDKFEEEYGIKVIETTYESNDEMLSKLLAGNKGEYDIAVPTNYYIEAMRENDLLEPIDKDAITNFDNIDKSFTNLSFDPDNEYTVPYMGTLTAWIGNKPMLDELGVDMSSYDALSDPALKQNILFTDDTQDIIQVGLAATKLDPLTQNVDDITTSKDYLLSINDNIKSFSTALEIRTSMAKGEAALAHMYSGDALLAMDENSDLELMLDNTETSMSMDCLVLLKGSEHKKESELFIDFLLRPDISAELTNEFPFVCFNSAAAPNLDDNLKNSPLCVLTDAMKEKAYFINSFNSDIIDAEIDAMTEIKSNR